MSQILTNINNVADSIRTKQNTNVKDNWLEEMFTETDNAILPKLKDMIYKYTDESLWDLLLYSLNNKKHYERAYFVRLGCEAIGGGWKNILKAMASVELRYASLVVIDDVFDKTLYRMNNPSLPKYSSTNITITIGAILKSLSNLSLYESIEENKIDNSTAIKTFIQEELSHYKVYQGQYTDLLSENMAIQEMSEDNYFEMIKNTTGVDVAYCLMLGGVLSKCNENENEQLYEVGLNLGTAMQLRDDLIDYVNSAEVINKTPFKDFEQSKKRIPLILAYNFADDLNKKVIRNLLVKSKLNDSDKLILTNLILNDGVLNHINNYLQALKESAISKFSAVCNNSKTLKIVENILDRIMIVK